MARLDVKKYEQRLNFLENELYVKRDQLNEIFHEFGMNSIYHNFNFDVVDLRESHPDAELDIAHKIDVIGSYNADIALQGKLRTFANSVNELFIEASRLGIRLNISQEFLYLDELPANEQEEYTGRWCIILKISAPNLDDALSLKTT